MKLRMTALLMATALFMFSACGTPSASSSSSVAESSNSTDITTSSSAPESSESALPENTDQTTLAVATLKGPTAMGMLPLMEQNEKGTSLNGYNFVVAGAPDQIVGGMANGEYDLAAVPVNLAATLYQKTKGEVVLLAVNTLGTLSILEKGNTVNSFEDLRGKTIYATGMGSTPEYVLNYLLKQNGIDPEKDVTIEYKTEHTELASLLSEGKAEIALLPQPFATTVLLQNKEVRVALDLNKEWDKATAGNGAMTMGCIAVRKAVLESNPQAVANFLKEYQASVEQFTAPENIDASAELCVKYEILPKAPVAKAAIPNCAITFMAGDEMKQAASQFIKILFDANPKSVGGKLPDENFYITVSH